MRIKYKVNIDQTHLHNRRFLKDRTKKVIKKDEPEIKIKLTKIELLVIVIFILIYLVGIFWVIKN